MPSRLLAIDDDRATCDLFEAELGHRGFRVTSVTSANEALERLANEDFDVVLTDLTMSEMSGAELCKRAVALREGLPVIVVTAYGTMESAISAIRAGASDFVTKPVDMDELAHVVDRCMHDHALRDRVRRLRTALSEVEGFEEMVGESPAMRQVYDLVARIADTDTTVLVTGESGTGKELVARAIHARSGRRSGPFVSVSCAAMPETLLESELFGHVKGAFTDARGARNGLFVKARGGTLFLDEIGDTSLGMQAKLLRALQERMVRPVGGDDELAIDTRIVAATNVDLVSAVRTHKFREDLLYRLDVLHLELPPLRARGNDVLLLAQRFVERYAAQSRRNVVGLMAGAAEALLRHSWPGNVRELQNCIERAVALARFERIAVDDLPDRIREVAERAPPDAPTDGAPLPPLADVEHRHILRVLDACNGNKALAARTLGIDRRTLYRKLERGIDGRH